MFPQWMHTLRLLPQIFLLYAVDVAAALDVRLSPLNESNPCPGYPLWFRCGIHEEAVSMNNMPAIFFHTMDLISAAVQIHTIDPSEKYSVDSL